MEIEPVSAEACKLIHLPCPKCQEEMKVPLDQQVRCPSCGLMLRIARQVSVPPEPNTEEELAEREHDPAASQRLAPAGVTINHDDPTPRKVQQPHRDAMRRPRSA